MKLFLNETITYSIKAYFIYTIIKSFSLFRAIPLLYILFTSYHYLISKLFKLTYLSFDKSLLGFGQSEQYTINLLACFDSNFNLSKCKEAIISRAINQIPKLHSIIVYRFLNYYWQTVPVQSAYEKISTIELSSKQSLHSYLQSSANIPIKQLNNIPYEINLIKYTNEPGGAIHLKFDHIISDGLGYLSVLCLIADNFSQELFPKVMHNKFHYSFLHELKDTFLFPLFIFYAVYMIITLPNTKVDFKKMHNWTHTGQSNFAISQWYPIEDIRALRNEYKVGFNDSVVGIYLASLKKQFPKIDMLNIVIPFGYTPLPKNASECTMSNIAQGFMMGLPLIESFEQLKDIHRIICRNVFNSNITSIPLFLFRLFAEVLPVRILRLIGNYIIFKTDMLITNVPGPDIPMQVGGSIMTDFYPIVTNGPMKAFITIGSYNKQFRYVLSYDSTVHYDPNASLRIIDDIMTKVHNKDYSL